MLCGSSNCQLLLIYNYFTEVNPSLACVCVLMNLFIPLPKSASVYPLEDRLHCFLSLRLSQKVKSFCVSHFSVMGINIKDRRCCRVMIYVWNFYIINHKAAVNIAKQIHIMKTEHRLRGAIAMLLIGLRTPFTS